MGSCISTKEKKDREIRLSIFLQNSSQCKQIAPEQGGADKKLLQLPSKRGSQKTQILTRNAAQEVKRLYKVHEQLLGAGAYGQVFLAELKNDPSRKYAIKIMHMKKMSEHTRNQMREELNVLHKVDHPHVVKYVQSFEDDKYLYIIMEYIQGHDLYMNMDTNGIYSEQAAARLIYRILEAFNHIHSAGVVHRDVKPDNIMINQNGEPKIIDFGLSKDIGQSIRELKTIAGSKMFMAPEIIDHTSHSFPCDMWSLGIILFMMLSGSHPFDPNNLEHEIVNDALIFLPEWDRISQLAKDLIRGLLEKNPYKRLNAKSALDHIWFKTQLGVTDESPMLPKECDSAQLRKYNEEKALKKQVSVDVVNKLSKYRAQSKVKVAALNVFLHMVDPKDIEPLIAQFKKMDTEKTGLITARQLHTAMQEKDINLNEEEVKEIIAEMDLNGNQKINYSEFLTATVEVKQFMTDEKLFIMFKHFDVEDKGFVTSANISQTMSKMGKMITCEELNASMRTHKLQTDN